MTTCTPVYALPYQTGSDRPCDSSVVWCNFANTVETQLDAFDAIVDRTVDTAPLAVATLSVTANLPSLGGTTQLAWDTVNADTASMIDLTANPYAITLPRYGRYWVSFWYQVSGLAAAVGIQSFLVPVNATAPPAFSSITGPFTSFYSDGASFMYMSAAAEIRFGSTQASPVFANITGTPGTTGIALAVSTSSGATIPTATLSAVWIGDLS